MRDIFLVFGKFNIVLFSILYFSNSIILIPLSLKIAPSISATPIIVAPFSYKDFAEFNPTLPKPWIIIF